MAAEASSHAGLRQRLRELSILLSCMYQTRCQCAACGQAIPPIPFSAHQLLAKLPVPDGETAPRAPRTRPNRKRRLLSHAAKLPHKPNGTSISEEVLTNKAKLLISLAQLDLDLGDSSAAYAHAVAARDLFERLRQDSASATDNAFDVAHAHCLEVLGIVHQRQGRYVR